jgi:hypothetical protein
MYRKLLASVLQACWMGSGPCRAPLTALLAKGVSFGGRPFPVPFLALVMPTDPSTFLGASEGLTL